MSTAKHVVKKMLQDIPANSSFQDIQYHIYVREKIENGLNDIKKGRTFTQKQIERRMNRWLGK